jgi:hypothetical protein
MSKRTVPAKGGATPAEGKKLFRIVDDLDTVVLLIDAAFAAACDLLKGSGADPLLALLRVIRAELMAARDELHAAGQKGGADA